MIKLLTILNLCLLFAAKTSNIWAAEPDVIYKIEINKEISNTTQIYLSKGLAEAKQLNAKEVIIHLNTYGGLVNAADSMRTAILYSPIPVSVFIDNNAASAGALISVAAKNIFMRKGANIGAATVVNQTAEAAPDKYQSYMRSMMRSTAEAHGKDTIINGKDTTYKWKRDPLIAEAMVDKSVVIPNVIDSGRVLTLTTDEAVKFGYCDGVAESIDEVIVKHLGYDNYEIKSFEASWVDNLRGFLLNPILQSILIMVIIGGIYFEMQTPGIGFPSAAAITAAVIYFTPLYIEGVAQNWEIIIFIIGLILIVVEIFIIPGFGVAGIGGIILIVSGLTMALLNNTDLNFEGVSHTEVGEASLTVLLGIGIGFGTTIWLSNKIGHKGVLRRIALETDLEESFSSPSLEPLVGKKGMASTVLRPSGKVIIDGKIYDGISDKGYIDKGTPIKIIRFENAQVYVITDVFI